LIENREKEGKKVWRRIGWKGKRGEIPLDPAEGLGPEKKGRKRIWGGGFPGTKGPGHRKTDLTGDKTWKKKKLTDSKKKNLKIETKKLKKKLPRRFSPGVKSSSEPKPCRKGWGMGGGGGGSVERNRVKSPGKTLFVKKAFRLKKTDWKSKSEIRKGEGAP